jgi:hypothetical protein
MRYFFYFCYMSKGRYNYYDPEYDPKVTEGNELLLMVSESSFAFVILQTETKKVLVWGENYDHSELSEPVELKSILSAKYNGAKAMIPSKSFTIIPKELYKESDIDEYSRFLTIERGDMVLVNDMDADSYIVFKAKESLFAALVNRVDKNAIFCPGKVLVAAVSFAKHDNQNIYAHIEGNTLQLLYFRNALLSFYNTFEFANPDELMYFVVLTANELELNLDETSIIMSGEVNISDKKIHRLSDLLPKVYLNQSKIVLLPQGFLPHQIFLLSGLTLCASLVEN